MTVASQETIFHHVGNGVTVTFAYGCQIPQPTDLEVYLDDILTTSGFTVAGIGALTGGTVTFSAPPASGVAVRLEREVALERLVDYQNNGDFRARVVNVDFDRLWMALQQHLSILARALRFPSSETNTSGLLPPAAARANNLMGFDAAGNLAMIGMVHAPERPVQREIQNAAAGQTVFTLERITYTPGIGSLAVYDGGFRLIGTEYAETSSDTVTFHQPPGEGAELLFEAGSGVNSQSASDAAMIPYIPSAGHATNVAAALGRFIDAADEGFSVGASGTVNRDAVLAAVARANGREVRVIATSDFQMSEVIIQNMPVNLIFIGGGRVDKSVGNSGVMQIRASYTNIQNITAIARVPYVVDGNPSGVATRLSVADSAAYKRGDIVRVISDDIEVQARADAPRRMGEAAVVIGIAAGFIYLSTDLEDRAGYITNPRVAILPQRKYSVKGLRVLSNLAHTGQLMNLVALYKPHIEFDVENHGWIGINSNGSYLGEFHVRGSGKGDGSGSLGYLASDISGFTNKFISPHGKFWRHLLTTGHNQTTLNDAAIHLYGGTRSHTVIGGVAEACQGVPWDEHEGARRTRWIDCSAFSFIHNNATAGAAFQMRGADAKIINPTVDKSFDAVLRVSEIAVGTATIIGGRSECDIFYDASGSSPVIPIYVIDHANVRDSAQSVFGNVSCDVYIKGGRYEIKSLDSTNNNAQFISVLPGGRYFLDNPEFRLGRHPSTPGTSFRFLRSATGAGDCLISGRCRMSSDGVTAGITALLKSDNVDSRMLVNASWTGGTLPVISNGAFNTLKYGVTNLVTPASSATNVVALDDYIKTIGSL